VTTAAPLSAANRAATAELAPATFDRVARLAAEEAGLTIAPTKRAMVQSRIFKRVRALGLPSFEAYLDLVEGEHGRPERREMISALTTNVSHFFREQHHFDTLRERILPGLLKRAASGGRVRIWSAGCSSGQEPYSIAMEILRLDPRAPERDIRILGSDIDQKILEVAQAGSYDATQMQAVTPADRKAFFTEAQPGRFTVLEPLRRLVAYRELNLLARWPMTGRFDAIFCRNVVIYFEDATQRKLWPRFQAQLAPGGSIFVGHSERIPEMPGLALRNTGVTTYTLPAATAAA
jgi:chemotaxis protein methyltransferase CheR